MTRSLLPMHPLANDSSDEDEAAVEGEVLLAAGDDGFDDGPLVLDRNIPEQDEVHRVLGLIQIHSSRDVQSIINKNLWGLLCFMTYASVAGTEDDLDGVSQYRQANLDFTALFTGSLKEMEFFRANFFAHLSGGIFPPFFNAFVTAKRLVEGNAKFNKKKFVMAEDKVFRKYLFFGHVVLGECVASMEPMLPGAPIMAYSRSIWALRSPVWNLM